MSKQPQLSPEKYIITKARSLPIHKCYVTSVWEETKMANVIVMRRHVNGNLTAGMYLIDLMCLGVKDTIYFFNMPEEAMKERLDLENIYVEEADYDLVHNLIYAGRDFAMEFDIKPHKDFSITKYVLEEDDERIPLIEIAVGDENGNPSLLVDSSYNYVPVLQKLKQHAGEGNYTFYLNDEQEDDEDDEDFDDDDDDNEEFLDFNVVSKMETDELRAIVEDPITRYTDQVIVHTELLLRELDETEGGVLEDPETLKTQKDYLLFQMKQEQWQKAHEESKGALNDIFPQLRSLGTNENNLDSEALMAVALKLLAKYKSNDAVSFMIVSSIPMITIIEQLGLLENDFEQYTPAVQLFLTSYAVIKHQYKDAVHGFIINAANVEMAYPFNRVIHGMHHKLFWLVKAIDAIRRNDKEQLLHYHNLLRISGTGDHVKFLYAAQLQTWLQEQMGLEADEEEDVDNESL